MTSLTGRVRSWSGPAAAVLLLAVPAVAAGAALDLLYERTVMTSAGVRCRLFNPAVGAALDAARLQARGAALRAGTANEVIAQTEQRARAKAAGQACDSKDLNIAAGRVRSAFEGYSRLARMDYPGDVAGWKADRSVSKQGPRWKLLQESRFGFDQLRFGLAGQEGQGALAAVAIFQDGAQPYAARLVMRDVKRTRGPFLDKRAGGRIPLSGRMPPRVTARTFSAEARAPATGFLLPANAKTGWTFRFPAAAAVALAELDPREAVAVEFVFAGRSGETVRRAYIEVGDFAAGRAFLAASAR